MVNELTTNMNIFMYQQSPMTNTTSIENSFKANEPKPHGPRSKISKHHPDEVLKENVKQHNLESKF